jgi:protein TonB
LTPSRDKQNNVDDPGIKIINKGRREMPPITQVSPALRSRTFGLRALVADFDSASLETLSSYLKEMGMEITTAKDGLTALELFRSQRPQIVFLEAMLPKISGFELSQQIYIESQGKVPVVIITGIYKDSRHRVEAIQTYKAAAFLTKPWQREELASTILDVLGPAVKPPDEEEELMLESLEEITPIIKEKVQVPLARSSAQPQSVVPETKVKKSVAVSDEVDKLLEKTLADLGFEGKKKAPAKTGKEDHKEDLLKGDLLKVSGKTQAKTAPPSPEIKPTPAQPKLEEAKKPEPQVQAPEKPGSETGIKRPSEIRTPPVTFLAKENFIDREKQPFAVPTLQEKKAAPEEIKSPELKARPAPLEEEAEAGITTARPTLYPAYLEPEHEEKKRPSSSILFGVAGAVALTLLGLLIFRPKKEAPLVPPAAREEKAISATAQELPSRLEEQEVISKPPKAKEVAPKLDSRLASLLPVTKEEPPVEEPPVLVAESGPAPLALTPPTPPVKIEHPNPAEKEKAEAQAEKMPAPQPEPSTRQIKEGDLLPLEEVDIQPRPIKVVEPKYPELAKQMGLEGTVVVNALISEKGDVLRAEILRGIKNGAPLEQAALAAVRQWKFSPAVKDGVKVKVWKPIETRFRLRQ